MLFSSGQSPPSHPGPGAGSLSPSLFQKGLPARPRSPGVPMELTQPQCSYLVEAAELWGNTLALGAWCAGVCKEARPLCSAAPEQATQLASFPRESLGHCGAAVPVLCIARCHKGRSQMVPLFYPAPRAPATLTQPLPGDLPHCCSPFGRRPETWLCHQWAFSCTLPTTHRNISQCLLWTGTSEVTKIKPALCNCIRGLWLFL